jgi:hypothetical protein
MLYPTEQTFLLFNPLELGLQVPLEELNVDQIRVLNKMYSKSSNLLADSIFFLNQIYDVQNPNLTISKILN